MNFARTNEVNPGWLKSQRQIHQAGDLVAADPSRDVRVASVPDIKCISLTGDVITLAQMREWWPAPLEIIHVDPGNAEYVVRLVEMRQRTGPSVQIVNVKGLQGEPLKAAVARWWPGAPALPAFPGDCQLASRWKGDRALHGWTNDSGAIGFGMGTGDKAGSSAVWVIHCQAPSDFVGGLGWKPLTNHDAIELTYQVFKVDDAPPPPPPPPPPGEGTELERIAAATEHIAAFFSRG